MTIAIRRGEPCDAPAAAELYLRARKAAAGAIPALAHDDDDVRGFFAGVVVAERELWLAEASGAPAALLVLNGDWIDQLYVEPELTGRGIGSALLEHAKRERPARLRLWSFRSNVGAQRFYERHGFRELQRTDGSENEERSPDILYAWG